MRFRRKSALEAPDEAAKLRHDLRLRWLDEAEQAANHENEHPHVDTPAFTATPEAPSEYDPDYRSRRPYIGKEPQTVTADMWSPWITDAAMTRMAKAIINLTPDPDFYTPQERTTMNDEIKAGDTVRQWHLGTQYRVLAVEGEWLWLQGREDSEDDYPLTPVTGEVRAFRKLTPCPEGWANVYPEFISWHSTKEAAVSSAARRCIGVLHLLPSGDTEFIRTEEL